MGKFVVVRVFDEAISVYPTVACSKALDTKEAAYRAMCESVLEKLSDNYGCTASLDDVLARDVDRVMAMSYQDMGLDGLYVDDDGAGFDSGENGQTWKVFEV